MVSIIPQETPADLIGKMMGQSLSENLPRGLQQMAGLQAIDRLQGDIAGANGDISKIIPALAKAYTLNPNLERSGISQLVPLAQRKAGAQDFPVGGGRVPTQKAETGKTEPVRLTDLVQPRASQVQDPQGIGQFQLPYGVEEFAGIRQAARQRGYTQEMEDRFIADAKEINDVAQAGRNVQTANYAQQQQERSDTLQNQKLFSDYLSKNAPEFVSNPDEREIALKESEKPENMKESSFERRLANVRRALRPYQQEKAALQKALQRPLTGWTKEQTDFNRKRAQRMVDMGQKDQLRLMIAQGGGGEVEEATLLNPLNNSIDQRLKMFKFQNPLQSVQSIEPDSPEYTKQLQRGTELLQKQMNGAVDYISKSLETGNYNNPGTNLLLLRNRLMTDGKLSWEQAGQLIEHAIEKSGKQLDQHQQIDFQKLAYPPLTGDSYSETILNNLLFPVTRKQ